MWMPYVQHFPVLQLNDVQTWRICLLVANKYGRALMLYSKCHELFISSDRFSEEMFVSLRTFPNLTILGSIMLTVVIK